MEVFAFHLATLSLSALFGGMVAFSVLFAPLIFTQLQPETAGRFIRLVFPWYYLYILAFGLLTGLLMALAGHGLPAVLAAGVGLVCVYTRWVLMPEINKLRDVELAGDERAGKAFSSKHRLSVGINAAQLLVCALLLWFWAVPPVVAVAAQ